MRALASAASTSSATRSSTKKAPPFASIVLQVPSLLSGAPLASGSTSSRRMGVRHSAVRARSPLSRSQTSETGPERSPSTTAKRNAYDYRANGRLVLVGAAYIRASTAIISSHSIGSAEARDTTRRLCDVTTQTSPGRPETERTPSHGDIHRCGDFRIADCAVRSESRPRD